MLDLVFWVCRTSVTQAWKTHVSNLGRCRATSQQCLGEWFGRLFGQVHVNLEILKQEHEIKLLLFIMMINSTFNINKNMIMNNKSNKKVRLTIHMNEL